MAASIEALFLILDPLDESTRTNSLCLKRFYQTKCSYCKTQLGLTINTRNMTVSLPMDNFTNISQLLNTTWHSHRKTSTIMQGVKLLGILEHASLVNP